MAGIDSNIDNILSSDIIPNPLLDILNSVTGIDRRDIDNVLSDIRIPDAWLEIVAYVASIGRKIVEDVLSTPLDEVLSQMQPLTSVIAKIVETKTGTVIADALAAEGSIDLFK